MGHTPTLKMGLLQCKIGGGFRLYSKTVAGNTLSCLIVVAPRQFILGKKSHHHGLIRNPTLIKFLKFSSDFCYFHGKIEKLQKGCVITCKESSDVNVNKNKALNFENLRKTNEFTFLIFMMDSEKINVINLDSDDSDDAKETEQHQIVDQEHPN